MRLSCLFGGARLRSRTLKALVVLGAVLALASIMAESASATFPAPNPVTGWYIGQSVSGTVDFHPNDHEGIQGVTCVLSNNTIVGQFIGASFNDPSPVPVTVFGDSTDVPGLFSPVGFQRETVVTCTGTLLEQNQICIFGICTYIPGSYSPAGPATARAFLHIDHSPPVNVTATPSTNPNANGWYSAPATVHFDGSDPHSGTFNPILLTSLCHSGSPFGPGGPGQSIGPPDGTAKTIAGGCLNNAGLSSGFGQTILFYNYDATAPTLSPTVSPNPVLRGASATASANAGDNLSGVASSSCGAVDTSALGSFSVSCDATDKAGNSNSASASYQVVLGFAGFFQPVDMDNTNVAKAGQTIPLKFRVSDANGPVTDLSTVSARVQGISCDLGDTLDQIEEYAQGASGLQNLGGGAYQFNWATPKSYASSCKTLHLDVGGSDHTADFRFTK